MADASWHQKHARKVVMQWRLRGLDLRRQDTFMVKDPPYQDERWTVTAPFCDDVTFECVCCFRGPLFRFRLTLSGGIIIDGQEGGGNA